MKLKSVTNMIGDDRGGAPASYSVIEKADELRYTFGPVYSPNAVDAHGEYAEADDLRKMVWQFFHEGDKLINKQHGDKTIGKMVEIVQWPFDLEAELKVAGKVRKVKLPAGTVYAGVQWTPEAWPDVKKGKITGFSMEGRAVRIRDAADADGLLKFDT